MGRFFAEGGLGMFPTALFGLFFIALAMLHALRPDRRLGPVVVLLGAVTVASGLLGFAMGVSSTFGYLARVDLVVAPEGWLKIGAAGVAESLNNLILAMLLFIPAGLVGTVGAFRASRRLASA